MTTERGVSPVIGTILIVAIVVVLAGLLFVGVSSLVNPTSEAPQASLTTQPDDIYPGVTVRHQGGDALNAARVDVRGGVIVNGFTGQINAGDTAIVIPTQERVRVVWQGEDTSYILLDRNVQVNPYGNYTIDQSGDVSLSGGNTVNGGVRSQNGQVDAGENVVIRGAVVAATDLDVDQDSDVYGPVNSTDTANGDVVVGGGTTVYGNVIAGYGQVDIEEGVTVYGNVQASGPVYLDDNTIVKGAVDGTSITCGSNVTINGEDCSTYTS